VKSALKKLLMLKAIVVKATHNQEKRKNVSGVRILSVMVTQ
jgi:hypothetical protein